MDSVRILTVFSKRKLKFGTNFKNCFSCESINDALNLKGEVTPGEVTPGEVAPG
jgi:hypothetical protein